MRIWSQQPSDDIIGVTTNQDEFTNVDEPNRTRLLAQIKSLKDDLGSKVEKSIDKGRMFAYESAMTAIDNRFPVAKVVESLRNKSQEFQNKISFEGNEEQKKYFQGVVLGLIKATDLIAKRRFPSAREVSFYDDL